MDTKIKEITVLFPLITFIVYALGYVIITGYLVQFGVINDDLLNFSFIKAGLLFMLLLAPILFILYLNFDKPTDNYLEAKKYFPTLLVNVLTYLVFITIFLLDYKKLALWESFVFMLCIPLDSFLYLLATSLLFKDKKNSTKIWMQLIIPIILLSYLSNKFLYLFIIYVIVLLTGQIFVLALGVIADKKATWGHYSMNLIWLLFISYQFGRFVYYELPSYLGGGKPIQTTILVKPDNIEFLKSAGFTVSDTVAYKVDLLYISSDKYLIRTSDKIYYLSKNLFHGFIQENQVAK